MWLHLTTSCRAQPVLEGGGTFETNDNRLEDVKAYVFLPESTEYLVSLGATRCEAAVVTPLFFFLYSWMACGNSGALARAKKMPMIS